jgi:pimeloyl-ACP methyl ester carboxylesterase
MTGKILSIVLLLSAWLTASLFAAAGASNSDIAKERRWAEQVVDSLLDGDEAWLVDDLGHEFLRILTEGDADSGHAVMLMHGIGVHPNWPDVIYPLRIGLLEEGITNLSIQMAILANDADPRAYLPLFEEVGGRIEAALDYLDDAGYSKVTLVAHSMGAAMAVSYLSQANPEAADSLVIIGMSPGLTANRNIIALEKIKLPVFDLYGSDDLVAVLESAEARVAAGRGGFIPEYRQSRVSGANHFFQGHEAELLQQVLEWLQAHAN